MSDHEEPADVGEPAEERDHGAAAGADTGTGTDRDRTDRDGDRDRAADRTDSDADAKPQEPDPFDRAARGQLDDAAATGDARTAHAARENFAARTFTIRGDSQFYEGNYFLLNQSAAGPVLVDGPVPDEELRRLADVYLEAPGYQRMKTLLRARGLLVLCGEPGSGRTATALALLDELAADGVVRLDPGVDLRDISDQMIARSRGYLLELPGTDGPESDHHDPEPGGDPAKAPQPRPTELHLDRFSAQLCPAGAFAVVVVDSGELGDRMLAGRYGMRYEPPPSKEVLRRHLRLRLRDGPAGSLDQALALAEREDVREALGLDELRPAEAALLADHLARRQLGELSDDQLRAACALFVPVQVREWFAGADRPGTVPAALPALRTAAFRVAVAVFNGSPYSLAAEAAEQLAWEMGLALDPEHPPGRRLFGTHADHRPALARAVVADGDLDLGLAQVPARLLHFQGRALATAVLHEVWHGHHNARGPVARWLRALCDDPRPQVWVRASIASGLLCAWDWIHGYADLVQPMASVGSPPLRMAAATALAQAAREEAVRPAVARLLKEWARSDDDALRATAVLAHGYGLAAGSVTASLEQLGRTARGDTAGELLEPLSFSVARLLAGPEPGTVVTRLGDWLRDGRRGYADLVLLTVVRSLLTRATFLWGLTDVAELEPYASWPLVAGLVATRPREAGRLADLVRHTLATARSGAPALDGMATWMRRAARDEEQLRVLCRFLTLVAAEERDRDRLRHLLARQVRDVDRPLDKGAARRMWDAVEEGEEAGR